MQVRSYKITLTANRGFTGNPLALVTREQKNQIESLMKINESCRATFNGISLTTQSGGEIVVKSLKNCAFG